MSDFDDWQIEQIAMEFIKLHGKKERKTSDYEKVALHQMKRIDILPIDTVEKLLIINLPGIVLHGIPARQG